jgi:hypothetical protein
MNRRSFITKALAGIAAIPALGKLAGEPVNAVKTLPQMSGPLPYVKHRFVFVDDHATAQSQAEVWKQLLERADALPDSFSSASS